MAICSKEDHLVPVVELLVHLTRYWSGCLIHYYEQIRMVLDEIVLDLTIRTCSEVVFSEEGLGQRVGTAF